jgi:hypothetical protein
MSRGLPDLKRLFQIWLGEYHIGTHVTNVTKTGAESATLQRLVPLFGINILRGAGSMMMPKMGRPGGSLDGAVHFVGLATFHLHLHRSVVDVEAAIELCDHSAQDLLAAAD